MNIRPLVTAGNLTSGHCWFWGRGVPFYAVGYCEVGEIFDGLGLSHMCCKLQVRSVTEYKAWSPPHFSLDINQNSTERIEFGSKDKDPLSPFIQSHRIIHPYQNGHKYPLHLDNISNVESETF